MIDFDVGYEDVNDDETDDDDENDENVGIERRVMRFGYWRSEWEHKIFVEASQKLS